MSKNLQVVSSNHTQPDYALEQNGIVYDLKATPDNKFLLVTNFDKTYVEVISLADDMVIKQIDLTSEGGDILIDRERNKAYISSPSASCLYVLDLFDMTLKQKINLKGKCTKVVLTDKNRKIFYFDQKTKEVWSVELDNDYITKYIGSFPNVSKIEYANGKVYLTSRVASRIAIVDYETLNLISEMPLNEKPVDMLVYRNNLYILSATTNKIQVIDVISDLITNEIVLNTKGFSTKIYQIGDTNFALVSDASSNKYSIVNLDTKTFVKNNVLEVPVNKMAILPVVRKN
jgi:DNA-binding beta-propeller fold protein YncE